MRRGETPEELGHRVSALLCDELSRGGCIDTDASPLALVLMALTPPDVSRVRLGRLSPRAVSTLRLVDAILGVRFRLRPEPKGTIRKRADAAVAVDDEAARNMIAGKGLAPVAPPPKEEDVRDRRRGGGRKRPRDEVEHEEEEEDAEAAAAEAAALASRVEVAVTDSVIVSCVGMGYRNMARSVT